MARPIVFSVRITGARETLAAFRKLPKEASTELRKASEKLAKELVTTVRAAGVAEGSQAALVAKTVRAARDRVPVIQAGGSRRVGRRKARAGALVAGSEFGADYYSQFKPHVGKDSYWFFKSAEAEQNRIDREWNSAADDIIRRFTE